MIDGCTYILWTYNLVVFVSFEENFFLFVAFLWFIAFGRGQKTHVKYF